MTDEASLSNFGGVGTVLRRDEDDPYDHRRHEVEPAKRAEQRQQADDQNASPEPGGSARAAQRSDPPDEQEEDEPTHDEGPADEAAADHRNREAHQGEDPRQEPQVAASAAHDLILNREPVRSSDAGATPSGPDLWIPGRSTVPDDT